MTLVRWTPFKELLDMPREMRRMFGRPFPSLLEEPLLGMDTMRLGAPMDVFARDKDMVVRLEVPGIEMDDIDITLCESTLCISGERRSDKEVKEDDFYRRERSYGRFERSLPVPEKVTEKDIEATYEDGILEVRVKGAIDTVPAKHIEVKAGKGRKGKKQIKAKKG